MNATLNRLFYRFKHRTANNNLADKLIEERQKPVPLCIHKCDSTCKVPCCLNCAYMRDLTFKKSVGEVSDAWINSDTHTKRMYAPYDLCVFYCNRDMRNTGSSSAHRHKLGKPITPCAAWEQRFVVDAVSGKVTLIIK